MIYGGNVHLTCPLPTQGVWTWVSSVLRDRAPGLAGGEPCTTPGPLARGLLTEPGTAACWGPALGRRLGPSDPPQPAPPRREEGWKRTSPVTKDSRASAWSLREAQEDRLTSCWTHSRCCGSPERAWRATPPPCASLHLLAPSHSLYNKPEMGDRPLPRLRALSQQ